METSEAYKEDSALGAAKQIILQQLQHKKGGVLIIGCPVEVIDVFAMACQELQPEFDSRGVMPVFNASAVAERFSGDTNTIIETSFALVEASEQLASMTQLPALQWRGRLLAAAISKSEAMTPEQKIKYLKHAFIDTILG